jgi:truncated hemoglobin YjbI
MFEMSQRTAERWLRHMQASLDAMADEISEKFRVELMDFMTYTAYWLVLCQSTQKKFETMGPYFLNPPTNKDSD